MKIFKIYLDTKSGIFDPVYDELIQIPRYTPKHFDLLMNTFEHWKLMDFDLKYCIFQKYKPQETLLTVEKMLYHFYIKETCRNSSKTRKNFGIITELIEELMTRNINNNEILINQQEEVYFIFYK